MQELAEVVPPSIQEGIEGILESENPNLVDLIGSAPNEGDNTWQTLVQAKGEEPLQANEQMFEFTASFKGTQQYADAVEFLMVQPPETVIDLVNVLKRVSKS